jgi:hypothetical protein
MAADGHRRVPGNFEEVWAICFFLGFFSSQANKFIVLFCFPVCDSLRIRWCTSNISTRKRWRLWLLRRPLVTRSHRALLCNLIRVFLFFLSTTCLQIFNQYIMVSFQFLDTCSCVPGIDLSGETVIYVPIIPDFWTKRVSLFEWKTKN